MSKADSTARSDPGKPNKPWKPYEGFPLRIHAQGYWCKNIRGKRHYFGPRFDPADKAAAAAAAEKAKEDYDRQADALHAGRKPRELPEGILVKDAANAFLDDKEALVKTGELKQRSYVEYTAAANLVVAHMGKARLLADVGPDDFGPLRAKMAERWGPHRLAKMIQFVRSLFKHAYEAGILDRPVRFGPAFERPSKRTFRLHKNQQGALLFEKLDIGKILDLAGPAMKAMTLLALNGGMGNADCGQLPLSAVDLRAGWIDFPRGKTGIARRFPLWPETLAAIKAYLDVRPEAKKAEDAALLFITKYGKPWHNETSTNPVSQEFAKLLRQLGITTRKGQSFYALRHCFETYAGESRDQVAVDAIMGHVDSSMAANYRERISDERLLAVVNVVRAWLFGKG